jgi:trk system potassium uptake protein TrkA
MLKNLNIPFVVGRAASELHGNTLERIGADRVVYPELESGRRLAHIDFNAGVVDFMELTPGSGINKLHPPESMLRRTLEEAGLAGPDSKYGMVVMAIRRGRGYIINPSKDEDIRPGDLLVVAGRNDLVSKLYAEAAELNRGSANSN